MCPEPATALQRLHEGLHLPEQESTSRQIETGARPTRSRFLGSRDHGLLTTVEPQTSVCTPYNGRNVPSWASARPATAAHYLVNEGFGVVGRDGLKISPAR
jgi:hypothetical protein